MAESKPISAQGIADIEKLNENLRESLNIIGQFKEQVKETYNISAKLISANSGKTDTKSIDATTKALNETNEARKRQIELETIELKLQEQINLTNKAHQQALQEELKLKVAENRESDKAVKQAQKEEKARQELNSEYLKANKRKNDLVKIQRELSIRQKLNNDLTREEAKQLKSVTAEVQKLDKALKDVDEEGGIFFRSVGNYQKALEKFKKTNTGVAAGFLGGFLGGVAGAQISKGIDDIFAGTAEKAENFQLIIERTFNLISNVGVAVKNFIVGYAIPQFEQLGLKIERAFTFDSDKLEAIDAQLKETNKTLDSFKNPFEGIVDRIKETDELTKKQVKLRYEYIRQEAILAKQIQVRIGREEVLTQIAENDTLGFKTRAQASKDLFETQKQRLSLELSLASKQLDLQTNLVKISLEKEKLGNKFTDEQIRSLDFLKDEEAFRKINLEALDGLKTAQASYNQLLIENEVFLADRAEKDQKRLQDLLDNTLDNQKDIFDKTQTFNSSLLNNDKITFEFRKKILAEQKSLGEKSFQDQNNTLKEYVADRLKRENDLAKGSKKLSEKELKQRQDLVTSEIDLNELIKISDGQVIDQKLQALNISEQESLRIKQSLEERKSALRDRYDEEVALDQKIIEKNQRVLESKQAQEQENYDFAIDRLDRQYEKEEGLQDQRFIFTSKKLNELAKLEEAQRQQQILDQFNFEKDQINATIVDQDEKNQKILELESKLQHDLQKLNDDTTAKITANDRKQFLSRLDFAQNYADKFVELVRDELQIENTERKDYLDKQISDREANISAQQVLFEQGRENQLAFEQQQLAKLELQRKDAEERSARQQEVLNLIQATYQSYRARLNAGEKPQQALLGASSDTLLLKAVAKSVAGAFWDGSEKVSDDLQGNKVHNGRDGYIVAVDGGERVMTTAQNRMVGDMSNDELATLAYQYNKGNLSTAHNIYQSIDLQPLLGKIDDLHGEIASRPTQVFRLNEFGEVIEILATRKHTKKTVMSRFR